MRNILGVPSEIVLAASIIACGSLVVMVLTLTSTRRPLLLRLAIRNSLRRPLQSILVTMGLTVSTVIIAVALNTGDIMNHTVRSVVASSLGRADEVILALPQDRRRTPGELVSSLTSGTLLTSQGRYFPQERAESLATALSDDHRVAGLTPAIGETVTVINRDRQAVQGEVNVLALPPNYPPVFGTLVPPKGPHVSLADLQPGEAWINMEAAARAEASAGTHLILRTNDREVPITVKGLVAATDLSGAHPTLLLALPDYQRAIGREGQVNQVRVANRGDTSTSVSLSSEVTRALRLALADRRAAAQLFDLLRTDLVRAELLSLADRVDEPTRGKLLELRASLDRATASDDFIDLVTDPELERRLAALATWSSTGGSRLQLPAVSSLRVLDVKQIAQNQADRWGGAITSTFLLLGLFSLATGSLLIFQVFTSLAVERRTELGVTRALGARRLDVVVGFLLEGMLYAMLASLLGLALGVVLTLTITRAGELALRQYGFRLDPHLEPLSLVLAYVLGLLLSSLSIALAAWHASRLSIVSAIRDIPDPPQPSHSWRQAVSAFLLVTLGPLAIAMAISTGLSLVLALSVAASLLGLSLILRMLLARLRLRSSLRDRLAFSIGGIALVGYWIAPNDWPLMSGLRPVPRSLELFFLAGLSMVLGAVWVLVLNLRDLLSPLVIATSQLRSVGVALRAAAAHPVEHRGRTGVTIAMFALVIFSMVVASVLLSATHRAYSDPEALLGGFDLKADVIRPGSITLPEELRSAAAVREDQVTAIGRLAVRPGQIIELGPPSVRWQPSSLFEVDQGFIDGLRSPLVARAVGFETDVEVWQAVLDRVGFAVVAGRVGAEDWEDPISMGGSHLTPLSRGVSHFQPMELWVRDERGGSARKLTVIGVMDPRVTFGTGLYAGPPTYADTALPQRESYYLKASTGEDPVKLALGLTISFSDQGLRVSPLGEDVRRIQSVRTLLNELLQAFFGVGLLAGLAAIGVITVRAVIERRQQVALLRAIGFPRHMVRLSLLLETSLVALAGIGIGVSLGLALAQRLTEYVGRQFPEIVFSIPWSQVGSIAVASYLASLLMTIAPMWQIGRIKPADALKSE